MVTELTSAAEVAGAGRAAADRRCRAMAACLAAEEAVCAAQQAAGRVVLRRLRGAPADPPIVAADHTVTFGAWATVGAPQLQIAGKAFFEVELLELKQYCSPQFGWASAAFATSAEYSDRGVGDDAHSFGVDGERSMKWHGGPPEGGTPFDTKWVTGDVLGFAADPEAGRLLFAHNGEWRVAFDGVRSAAGGLHPALTGKNMRLRANFGDRGWAHGPPDASYTAAAGR